MRDIKKLLLNNKESICGVRGSNINEILNNCAKFLKNGEKIILFSLKNISDKEALNCAIRIRQLVSIYESLLFIDGRADIAKLCEADGLCLSCDDISLSSAKKIFDENKLYGINSKTTEDALYASENSFDFISVNSNENPFLIQKIRALNLNIKILNIKS